MSNKNKRFQTMTANNNVLATVDKSAKSGVEVMQFHKHILPSPVEPNISSDWERRVDYGAFNDYPRYLIGLYANSSIHSAIVNTKTTYINGDGLKYTNGSVIKGKPNEGEDMNGFTLKCIKDFLLFNYFTVEVIFNALNQPIEYHWIPAQNVRTNRAKSKFWVNDDWERSSVNQTIEYDRFNPYNNTDSKSKIYFYEGYFPSINKVYPQPEYNGCIMSITNDIAIKEFNLNNITNQFSPANIITFFMGSGLTEDVKKAVVSNLKSTYTGTTGGKFIVDFQEMNGKPAEVKQLSAGDWDKAYLEVAKNVADDIYRGHQVTSPMLMGVKTEGQLGGASELETAYEIFKITYVNNKRRELEAGFNILFTGSSQVVQTVQFTDKVLFNTQLSDALRQQVYTINELRALASLPALQGGDRLLSETSTTVQTSTPSTEPLPTIDEGQDFKKKDEWEKRELTEEDFDKISHLGVDRGEYELVEQKFEKHRHFKFDKTADVAKFLLNHIVVLQTYDEIKAALDEYGISVKTDQLKDILQELQDSGIIDIQTNSDGSINIEENEKEDEPAPNKDGTITMFAYALKGGVGGNMIIPTTRSFCRRVIENNKLYSREDIDTMSDIFGYNVFENCGGYYHNPSTGDTSKSCRHQWVQLKVKKKTN